MMKKLLPNIILGIACALAVTLVFTKRENAALKSKLDSLESMITKEGDMNFALPDEELTTEPTSIQIAAADVESPTNEVNAEVVEQTMKEHQRVMSSIAKMRENPTMNKMIEASQRGSIGALYADMIDYLGLDPEEANYFMDLLMSRQMAQVDFGMNLMSGQMSEEERQAAVERLGEVTDEMKEQMKEFLNSEEEYEEFEFYEKTIGERMALSQMDQALTASDDPLSNNEYRDLLDMMASEKEAFDWATNLHDQESADISPERFSEENMKKHTTNIHELNEQIFQHAMSMLTPEQFEAFKASIVATTDMQLAQFQMAGQLLRGQE